MTKQLERTPWFSAQDERPVRLGVYEFTCQTDQKITHMKYIVGDHWKDPAWQFHFTPCSRCQWRGLARDPRESV